MFEEHRQGRRLRGQASARADVRRAQNALFREAGDAECGFP